MDRQPIWEMVQECARELTKNGTVPFTRRDIIACIQKRHPRCDENSINPIIQGLTDNLKGGAPGADGKRILHSVGRGQFVLYSKKDSFKHNVSATKVAAPQERATNPQRAGIVPKSENALRDKLLSLLRNRFRSRRGLDVSAEGILSYKLPDGVRIGHASDILVTHGSSGRHVSIELKYRSAVTDQFKCRAFDALHMKKEHGDRIRTIMLYAKSSSGISIAQAERISYPFDVFIGVPAAEIGPPLIDRLEREITDFLSG